ncbi:MAG: hypothetical protein Q9165_008300 [Trypethelium subeluteriae]
MKVGKPKSKRVPVRLRHKIEKASAAKQRKQRKLEKKNPQWRSRLKKDPGIPNLFPYKDKILQEIEERRQSKEAEAARRKELARAQREGLEVAEEEAAIHVNHVDGESISDGNDHVLEDGEGEDEDMDEVRAISQIPGHER